MNPVALRIAILLVTALLLPACGGDSSSGGGAAPPPPPPPLSIGTAGPPSGSSINASNANLSYTVDYATDDSTTGLTVQLVLDTFTGGTAVLDSVAVAPNTSGTVNLFFIGDLITAVAPDSISNPVTLHINICRVDPLDPLSCIVEAQSSTITYYIGTTGSGTGLIGNYFNNKTLSGTPALIRIDPTINFDWQLGSPDAAINIDNFSIGWTGQIEAQFSEDYIFSIRSDDGVRLWIDGQLIISEWFAGGPFTRSSVALHAQWHNSLHPGWQGSPPR